MSDKPRTAATKEENGIKPKKPAPVPVRHTLTSMYRLLKANPLLKYQLKGEPLPQSVNSSTARVEINDKGPQKTLPPAAARDKKPLVRTQSARQAPKKLALKSAGEPQKLAAKPAPAAVAKKLNPSIQKTEVKKPALESTIQKEKPPQVVQFKTPNAYRRRSTVFLTPNTGMNKTRPSYASTPGPSAYDLQRRLNDWLKKRGKPIKTFDNLKKFGIRHDCITKNEENKENIEVEGPGKNDSYEELGIISEEKEEETKPSEEEIQKNLIEVAKEALKDLRKLILEGYPREQCEAWLNAIREKYKNLEEDPIYWECLAALEETVGHISAAVEYYRTAIVQGAEVKEVDESLEQMLQKFSLLNINSSEKAENTDSDKPRYDRNKVVLAARNVFKSTIIQFAIEERKQKKGKSAANAEEKKRLLVVTPVRRSTRRRTGFVVTPNVEVCSSVDKIRDATADGDVEFRHNQCLATKFY